MSDFEDLLERVGSFGRYQKLMTFLACLSCMSGCMQNMSTVFNMDSPDFRCAVPGLENDTYAIQNNAHLSLVNASIPRDSYGHFSGCSVFKTVDSWGSPSNHVMFDTNETMSCTRWVYRKDVLQLTIVSQLNLVCGQEEYKTHASMMLLVGLMVASLVCSPVSDMFGRRVVVLGTILVQTMLGFTFPFIDSLALMLVFKMLISITVLGNFVSVYVLVTEMVGPAYRGFVGVCTMYLWCVGMFVITLVFYFFRDWRHAQLILTVPGAIFFVLYAWLLPESPRWLMVRGRTQEAGVVLRKIAKVNNTTMPEKMLEIIAAEQEQTTHSKSPDKRRQGFCDIFSTPTLAGRFLILCFNWMAVNLCYYGLTLNVDSLIEGDLFLNFTLISVAEFVGFFACHVLIDRIGRKGLYCSTIILGGVACLATLVPVLCLGPEYKWINTVLSNVGKFGCTAAFGGIFLFTAELLPTYVRNTGLGACSFVGRIGAIISPYIASLGSVLGGEVGEAVPLVVFGGATLVAGLLALLLPETLNTRMPETLEDMQNMKRVSSQREKRGVRDDEAVLPLKPDNCTVNGVL